MKTISKIIMKIYIWISHQDICQDNHRHILHNTFNDFKEISTNIEAYILISKMNSIHERHVPSQEKHRSMNHTFLKITRWRNNRQTKRNSITCPHISLVTGFAMNQEFCNFDSVWEIYVNFSEDAQKFLLHKVSQFSPRDVKIMRELTMKKWNVWYSIYIGCEGNYYLKLV